MSDRAGGWHLDEHTHEIVRGNERIRLRPLAYRVLGYLLERQGETVTREELVEAVWRRKPKSDHAISMVIHDVRAALGDDKSNPKHLLTVSGHGYRLEARPQPPETEESAKVPAQFGIVRRFFSSSAFSVSLLISLALGATILSVYDLTQRNTPTADSTSAEFLFDRANYLWGLRGRQNNLSAHDTLISIIERDPDHGPSHALLADMYATRGTSYFGVETKDPWGLVEQHLARAEALVPKMASLPLTRARIFLRRDFRPDLAIQEVDRAITLAPDQAFTYRVKAGVLQLSGRPEEAYAALQVARSIDPYSPYLVSETVANLRRAGHYEEALALFENVRNDVVLDRDTVSLLLLPLGRYDEAFQESLAYVVSHGVDLPIETAPFPTVTRENYPEAYSWLADQVFASGDPEFMSWSALHYLTFARRFDDIVSTLDRLDTIRRSAWLISMQSDPMYEDLGLVDGLRPIYQHYGVEGALYSGD